MSELSKPIAHDASILFEMKPCAECPHNCVEGQPGMKCPYDKIAEDLMYLQEWEHIESRLEKNRE